MFTLNVYLLISSLCSFLSGDVKFCWDMNFIAMESFLLCGFLVFEVLKCGK